MVCPALAEKPGQSGGLKSASALGAENALPLGNSIAVCSPTNLSRGNDFRYRAKIFGADNTKISRWAWDVYLKGDQ